MCSRLPGKRDLLIWTRLSFFKVSLVYSEFDNPSFDDRLFCDIMFLTSSKVSNGRKSPRQCLPRQWNLLVTQPGALTFFVQEETQVAVARMKATTR
jgi:hypothetical protein